MKTKSQNKWEEEHPEKVKEYHRRYRKNHPEAYKNWYGKNRERRKNYLKLWRRRNKDKIRESFKLWSEKNKNHRKNWKRNYRKRRKKEDLDFKILTNLRSSIATALKQCKKSARTKKLIGCSIKELRRHLQSQFKKGMTWNNWGTGRNGKGKKEWHIDHIKPVASFNLSKPKEQKKCFHYTNLQPLWAEENLRKWKK